MRASVHLLIPIVCDVTWVFLCFFFQFAHVEIIVNLTALFLGLIEVILFWYFLFVLHAYTYSLKAHFYKK